MSQVPSRRHSLRQRPALLALLRGPDGRSFARALAVLVLINTMAAGIGSGAQAGADPAPLLCLTGSPGDPSGTVLPAAAGHDCTLCCLSRGAEGVATAGPGAAIVRIPYGTSLPRLAVRTAADAFLPRDGDRQRAPPHSA